MTGSCIGCKHLTVTPRKTPGDKEMDEFYRSIGYGRCRIDREAARWLRAEAPRDCSNLVAIDAAQIEARRRHLVKHQA
ncbi:hypothetical protein FHW83_005921 [Duganella sp. SG902]|uniref:hypothetical protein n=1 Tax=Duganella sp. SG902 TaxID=2587016 RepID=UPI00159E6381|nr:hypothetical protein [Duganella sp. SG902]NVM80076.1 hypothetical protein [Duganella sp. SG902]